MPKAATFVRELEYFLSRHLHSPKQRFFALLMAWSLKKKHNKNIKFKNSIFLNKIDWIDWFYRIMQSSTSSSIMFVIPLGKFPYVEQLALHCYTISECYAYKYWCASCTHFLAIFPLAAKLCGRAVVILKQLSRLIFALSFHFNVNLSRRMERGRRCTRDV